MEDKGQKRKYYKDNPISVKKRNQERRKKFIEGKIGFMCQNEQEKQDIMDFVRDIKSHLGEGNPNNVTSKQLLLEVFSSYKARYIETNQSTSESKEKQKGDSYYDTSFQSIDEDDYGEEQFFLTSSSNIDNLIKRVVSHSKSCEEQLILSSTNYFGHVGVLKFTCKSKHSLTWNSSQYLGQKYLANLRMLHGYFVSGILPNQFNRLSSAAGIGCLGESYINEVFSKYSNVVGEMTEEACDLAIKSEIQSNAGEEFIDILTDARHGTRKNSYHTDVVCIGANTHRVLKTVHVTKKDSQSSQKHELIGTQKLYDYFDRYIYKDKSIQVRLHCHDKNASVNKFIKTERSGTTSTNDTWHGTKNLTKQVKTVCSGPKYKEGSTWHQELSDKAASIKTHVYWAMKNCDGNEENLKTSILNIVEHYKGNHKNCHETSRCKTDRNYESSKIIITDPKAEKLLTTVLTNIQIYKTAKDYVHCMDTYYVESFNNALLQYHDKRINFSEKVYRFRTNIATLDWNEHVNRKVTSEKDITDPLTSRRKVKTKVLKRKTYNCWSEIWLNFVDSLREMQ